jgi:hypothetical protein
LLCTARNRLAQGFFLDAAGALAALQLGHNVGGREAIVGQCHHGVKPQIGYLVHQLGFVGAMLNVLGRHHHLGGLFADFFQKGVRPLVQQA